MKISQGCYDREVKFTIRVYNCETHGIFKLKVRISSNFTVSLKIKTNINDLENYNFVRSLNLYDIGKILINDETMNMICKHDMSTSINPESLIKLEDYRTIFKREGKIALVGLVHENWPYETSANHIPSEFLSPGGSIIKNNVNNFILPIGMEMRFYYHDFMHFLNAISDYETQSAAPTDDEDDEDHDNNLDTYTNTKYTEDSMSKMNTMSGHSIDTED